MSAGAIRSHSEDMTILSPSSTVVPAGTWTVDPAHSELGFSVRHAGIANVRGVFREFGGAVVAGADGALRASGWAAAASVDTGVEARDDHLRSADFFDAAGHPRLTFTAGTIAVAGGEVTVHGDLTLHGVTRALELRGELLGRAVDDEGAERIGLALTGALSRADYGMRFNQALGGGNVLVGDKVKLAIEISAVREP